MKSTLTFHNDNLSLRLMLLQHKSYGVAIQFYQPTWLPIGISHLAPWLRLDTFTVLSFFASALGFFIWRLLTKLNDYLQDNENAEHRSK